ncbi:ceramidase domain-containing protein [Pontibacterium granulatum]|uniref:ceramidase domain-containing protein n=1 Tax=Pontibacterium granulatum TaxID=2036029 RepID=UPI00249BDC7A|nr:ceramidase domain-containing protein [Pontibacterium granulatum]MDI3326642.1 ceramidase domain-containing protein [Pontibacterium granulatum]
MIDLYCERLDPTFWAEPVNALTNLSFLIAAFFIWRLASRSGSPALTHWVLILLAAAIGLGSFIFHTLASNWARWVDIIPILIFQLVFLWLYFVEIIGVRRSIALLGVVAFLALALHSRQYAYLLNGSPVYAPTIITLLMLGIWHHIHYSHRRSALLLAAAIFCLSLTFRTIDNAVCTSFPLGTHFLWHLLNGLVVFISAVVIVSAPRSEHPG